MRLYHKIVMQINGLLGCTAVSFGLWYQEPQLVILGIINFACVYLSYLRLKFK
jgi:hypothetical protein